MVGETPVYTEREGVYRISNLSGKIQDTARFRGRRHGELRDGTGGLSCCGRQVHEVGGCSYESETERRSTSMCATNASVMT
jgi:hypothetical protein